MITVAHEQRFGVPVAVAFDYVTDPRNWPAFWPGLIRVEEGGTWAAPGDVSRLRMRLLGREVELLMTLRTFEPNRLVVYDSTQAGLPDARHARQFDETPDGFVYRLTVEYEPRAGLRGLADRTVVRRGVARALHRTTRNLETALPRA
ncbi:MAG TPA: SRPBCC family protein [Gaiellaceae bacterium]|nr:SRPBCC family protein [Gaiellaceae bacterium]